MQALYQAETAGMGIEEALQNVFSTEEFIPETTEYAESLAREAWENREALDKKISKLSIDWPLERIGKVDHSILRLAIQELDSGDTPASVVIDEAVELAKKYSSEEAAKFINGILGTYLRKQSPHAKIA